jgi:hypothetical protein
MNMREEREIIVKKMLQTTAGPAGASSATHVISHYIHPTLEAYPKARLLLHIHIS